MKLFGGRSVINQATQSSFFPRRQKKNLGQSPSQKQKVGPVAGSWPSSELRNNHKTATGQNQTIFLLICVPKDVISTKSASESIHSKICGQQLQEGGLGYIVAEC